MTSPTAPSLNIALLLKNNLPGSVRALDEEIKRLETLLDAKRKERTTLTQISIAAGIDLTAGAVVPTLGTIAADDEGRAPDPPPEKPEARQVAA